jgi:hypothetical protein
VVKHLDNRTRSRKSRLYKSLSPWFVLFLNIII